MDLELNRHHLALALAREAVATMCEKMPVLKPVTHQFDDGDGHIDEVVDDEHLSNLEQYLTGRFKGVIEATGVSADDVFLRDRGMVPDQSNLAQFYTLMEALRIHDERNVVYQDVWKITGWKGAIFDIYKKATRLWVMFRGGNAGVEKTIDDAYDLINFACFFIRGKREGNEWGEIPR